MVISDQRAVSTNGPSLTKMAIRDQGSGRAMAMTLGLFPFVFAGAPFVKGAWIGWVVFLNGAVTHLTSAFGWRHCDYVRIVDTTTNVALC